MDQPPALSDGERNRVHFARMLKSAADARLLGERTPRPTSKPSPPPRRALEEFAGCAAIISHDRMFLDRPATHMLAYEGDSHFEWFEDNLSTNRTRIGGWARTREQPQGEL